MTETITKYVAETYTVEADFTNILPTGLTISSGTVQAFYKNGAEATNMLFASPTATVSGNYLRATVKAGSELGKYKVFFNATLSNAHIKTIKSFIYVEG